MDAGRARRLAAVTGRPDRATGKALRALAQTTQGTNRNGVPLNREFGSRPKRKIKAAIRRSHSQRPGDAISLKHLLE